MQPRHILLALIVVFLWGVNFVVISLGLRNVSPLALGVARFVLAAIPLIFILPRPKVPLRMLLLYSLPTFALQFGFLFTGMKLGMSAGLSSLLMQLNVFFTIGLSVVVLGEKPSIWQAAGAVLAFCGIGLVAAHLGGDITVTGLVMLIAAAASWGVGNIVSRIISMRYGGSDPLALVAWGSLFAVPPLVVVALVLDPDGFVRSFTHIDLVSVGAVAYLVYISTLFCFGAWAWLLGRYPVATVAPFTLLVPVFGYLSSALLLGEPLEPWKIGAAGLVIAGLIINLFGGRLTALRASRG